MDRDDEIKPPSRSAVQLGMFGVVGGLDMHVVAAHDRTLADGTSVFVAEHLRWNRPGGSRGPRGAPRARDSEIDPAQTSLFPVD